ncbi:MAG: winged helix DNA-binding protein [Vicinamibacterales bacterium]
MLATSSLQGSTAEREVQASLETYRAVGTKQSFLIAAAAGMGKTSFLEACVRHAQSRDRAIVVSGSVLASEGHFVHVLRTVDDRPAAELRDWKGGLLASLESCRGQRLVLAIDDFDQLAYKRDELARILAAAAADPSGPLLLLTCAASTVDRILGSGRPFENLLTTVSIEPLDEIAAEQLVQLRAPRLSEAARRFVVHHAGGHPGAIVFASRLIESLLEAGNGFDPRGALAAATEFAGAVYAEPWSALGPQQRAVLWHLSGVRREAASVTQIARSLVLQPSHVSAQLARLVAEGLIRRDGRGAYVIAPLLAQWISARGARASLMTDSTSVPRPSGRER